MELNALTAVRKGKNAKYYRGLDETLVCKQIGQLNLASGKLAVGDLIACDGYIVLNKEVMPGPYPVYLYEHHIEQLTRNAYLEVRFNDKIPTKYKNAIKVSRAKDQEGFAVYNLKACVMDASLLEVFDDMSDDDLINRWHMISQQFQNGYGFFDGSQIVGCESGIGNGVYGAYFGMDRFNNVCSLVLDFRLDESIDDLIIRFDWGSTYDDGNNHSKKIKEHQLPLKEIEGLNHLAVFLKWMKDHNLLSEELKTFEPRVLEDIDLRIVMETSLVFKGRLKANHFNEKGRYFANQFYAFNLGNEEGYPSCVDLFAQSYFGEDYNNEKYHDEAYLFVPYDDQYIQGLSKYIDEAWHKIMEEK